MSRRFKYSANLIHRYTSTITCPLCQCDRKIFRVDKKGRDRVRELLARFGGKHYNSISSKKFGYIFQKNILCSRALLFPCSTFTNRRIYNQQNKNNFIQPNKLEGLKKKKTSKDRLRFMYFGTAWLN